MLKPCAFSHAGVINEAKTSTRDRDARAGFCSLLFHLRRPLHHRDVDPLSRTRAGPAHFGAGSAGMVRAGSAHCRRARQHVAGRGRLLSLGRSCIRALLGFSKWLAHLDVFACGHGDLSGAVQSIFALLHSRIGRASGMAHLACDHLGRSMDQHSRFSECELELQSSPAVL